MGDNIPPTASNPAAINVTCATLVPASDISVVTDAADNCSVPVVAFVSDVSNGATCPEVITRTYSVTDACGNSINVTQTITVGDNIPPTASNPAPIVVACAGAVPASDISVVTDEADNCSVPVVAFVSDVSNGATCPEVITRTYSVTDACGNSINVTQTITVGDNIPPTASNPAAINVTCATLVPASDISVVTDAADNCSVPVVAFVSDVSNGATCPEVITRTYSVTDACGNSINVTQTITVGDNIPPTASNLPAVSVQCLSDLPAANIADVTDAADNCGVPVVAFVGDIDNGGTCPKVFTRTYSVTDACGNSINVTQAITVGDNIPPTATAPAAVTVQCAALVPASDVNAITDEADNCSVPVVTFVGDVSNGATCPEVITRTYRVTDACNNSIDLTQTITVGDNIPPTITTCPANQVFCSIPSGTYTIPQISATENCGGAVTYTYTITGATNRTGVGVDASGTFNVGVSTITWSATDGCGNSSTCITTVTINQTPTLSLVNTTCAPSLLTYDVSFTSTAGVISSTAGTVSGNTITGIPAGTNITITADNNGCTASLNVMAPVCACPPIASATNSNNPTICFGAPIPSLTVDMVAAGYQINWYNTAVGGVTIATNTNMYTPTNPAVGTYTYYVEVVQTVSGCVSTRTPVILTINPASTGSATATVCAPELPYTWNGNQYSAAGNYTFITPNYLGCDSVVTLSLTVTPGIDPTFTILDSICSGATPPILPVTSNNGITGTWSPAVVSNTTTGTYTFTPAAGQCANNTSVTITVRVHAVPTIAQMNVGSNSPICAGSTLNLYANGGAFYEWSGPASYAVTFQNPTRTNATVIMSGNYYVTVTTAAGCSSTATVPVTINPLPTATASNNGPLCVGSSLNLTSGGGTGYQWSGPSGYSNPTQNPTINPVTTANAGTYRVTVTNAAGCTSTAQTTLVVNALPNATASNNGPLCAGETLNLNSGTGTGYSWSGPNYTNNTQNPSITNTTINQSGTYIVTVTNGNGCTATAQTIVSVNDNPIPTITGDTIICRGESTTLTANGASTYVWGSQTGASINVSPNTTTIYQVIATSAQGCTGTTSTTVNVSDMIMNSITSVSDTCSRSEGSITLNVGNGIGSYTYQWSNAGNNSNTIGGLTNGDYFVTITDAAGCQLIDTINVGNFPLPILSLASSSDDHCSLGIGAATVVATGGTGNYNYQWNTIPVQNTDAATNLTAGSYTVQVNDEYCSNTLVVNVGNIPGPVANANYTTIPNGDIQFIDQSNGAVNWIWQLDQNVRSNLQNPTWRYNEEGSYDVVLVVADAYGCQDSTTIQIVIDGEMEIWIPDAFSPNGDGINDVFKPSGNGYGLEGYEMVIYDRWGQIVFTSSLFNVGWDGKMKGVVLDINGVFVYRIVIYDYKGKMFIYKGHVTILGSDPTK